MSNSETTATAKIINVGIIEDRREIRDGLGMLIDDTDGFYCTGKFGLMEEGLRRLKAADSREVIFLMKHAKSAKRRLHLRKFRLKRGRNGTNHLLQQEIQRKQN
jgi:hypothetical protein